MKRPPNPFFFFSGSSSSPSGRRCCVFTLSSAMVFLVPSAVFETKSTTPVPVFVNTLLIRREYHPVSPLPSPFAKPFAPPCLAPLMGCVIIPLNPLCEWDKVGRATSWGDQLALPLAMPVPRPLAPWNSPTATLSARSSRRSWRACWNSSSNVSWVNAVLRHTHRTCGDWG